VRLHGLEDCNRHSFERFIYIHGTHQEERLGSPASFGCIRMANDTLVRWVNELPDNELRVWIGALTATP
jgi:hypothetical protein